VGVKNFLAWRLSELARPPPAWSLRLEAFKKLLAAGQVSGTEVPLIVYKIV